MATAQHKSTAPAPASVDGFNVLLAQLWRRFNQEFKQLLPLAVSASFLQIILGFLPDSVINTVFETSGQVSPGVVLAILVLLLLGLVATVWGSLALTVAVARPHEAKDWRMAFRLGAKYFWPSLTTSVIVGLIVLGGLILLILPGVYWGILFGLSRYLVVKENLRDLGALSRSAELVRGHWWTTFWWLAGFGLLYGICLAVGAAIFNSIAGQLPSGLALTVSGALNGLLLAITLPFPLLAQAVLYNALAGFKPKAKVRA